MQDSTPLVVGIDVGGTKTRLGVCAGRSRVADLVRTSSGRRPHEPAAGAWLAALPREALSPDTPACAVASGGHACDTPRQCEEIRSTPRALPHVPCHVVSDAEPPAPAAGGDKGVGLVAGTGPVAVGRSADSGLVRVGGWGAVLGDKGGSAGLAGEAVRAVRAAHDHGETTDGLALRLVAASGVSEVPSLGAALDSASAASANWGRHAPAVFADAEGGSRSAGRVIAAEGRSLARLVERLAERSVAVDDVVVAGALFSPHRPLHRLHGVARRVRARGTAQAAAGAAGRGDRGVGAFARMKGARRSKGRVAAAYAAHKGPVSAAGSPVRHVTAARASHA